MITMGGGANEAIDARLPADCRAARVRYGNGPVCAAGPVDPQDGISQPRHFSAWLLRAAVERLRLDFESADFRRLTAECAFGVSGALGLPVRWGNLPDQFPAALVA